MEETRGGKYGRCLASWIGYTINTIPEGKKEDYRTRFLKELDNYSFKPRKVGEPLNDGCVHELKDIEHINVQSPEDLAILVKEGIHLMYQKNTAEKVMNSLTKFLQGE